VLAAGHVRSVSAMGCLSLCEASYATGCLSVSDTVLQGVRKCLTLLKCYRTSVSDITNAAMCSSVSVPDYMLQGAFHFLMASLLQGVHV
jgi:hypothetical protein